MASLVWRKGVRTFVAAPRGRTLLSFFIGALAAAPGSMVMRRASVAGFSSREFRGLWRAAFFVERPCRRSVKSSPTIGQAFCLHSESAPQLRLP